MFLLFKYYITLVIILQKCLIDNRFHLYYNKVEQKEVILMFLALTNVLNWVLPIVLGLFIGYLIATRRGEGTKDAILSLEAEEFRLNMRKGQLIDIRKDDLYKDGHINGARNFSKREILQNLFKLRKDQAIFLYDQNESSKVKSLARKLVKKEYKPIYILKGGFDNWSFIVKK